ncbi:hypothetical protein SRB5_16570 [Streptomyces sp. RB5]|uniref:DUF4333 domain-containing protein n=1 Tax=Streptomyces smaragdinus TaxID=2585196 RepID=A0A7K0CDI8_9ACTN|nr:DUF4333 domain-containing protein [Streptomyces smaragdinus]MQY11538.1 hypothetical protein [Streptomyces smaragdinus]
MTSSKLFPAALAVGALTLFLAACSVDVDTNKETGTTKKVETGATGPASVSTDELEKKVSSSLTETVGQTPESVDCPDSLESKEGATTRCTLTAGDGTQFGVTVTAGKPNGASVHLNVKVDDKPM